ncbi:MAG: hypothetical protein H7176_14565 [Bdellovibrionales bacterium]|nr:hypothetical protein [Massilia sp.]
MKKFLFLLLVSGSAVADDASMFKCRALPDGQRLACYDAIALGAPARAAATRQEQEKSFGLVEKKAEVDAIESTIPGSFDGWGPNQLITLGNGQVWRVIDDSTGVVYGTDLKVTIERSSFGATFMVINGTTKSPKVKRLR